MRTKTRKILSIVLALAMITALAVPVFAQGGEGTTEPKSEPVEKVSINMLGNFTGDRKVNKSEIKLNCFEVYPESAENITIEYKPTEPDECLEEGKMYTLQFNIKGNFKDGFSKEDVTVGIGYSEPVVGCKITGFEKEGEESGKASYKISIEYEGITRKSTETLGNFPKGKDDSNVSHKIYLFPGIEVNVTITDFTGFDHWEVVSGNLVLTEEQKKSHEFKYILPNSDNVIRLVYKSKASTDPLTEVPEELKNRSDLNLDTIEDIKTAMCDALKKNNNKLNVLPENQFEFYDVKPMYYNPDTCEWEKITSEDKLLKELPLITSEDGKCKIILPYPEGTNKDDYNFFVAHLITLNERFAGTVETPEVVKTDDGLEVTVTGFSPFTIAWEKIQKPVKVIDDTPIASSDSASDKKNNILKSKKDSSPEHAAEEIANTDASFSSLLIALPAVSAAGAALFIIKNKKHDEIN